MNEQSYKNRKSVLEDDDTGSMFDEWFDLPPITPTLRKRFWIFYALLGFWVSLAVILLSWGSALGLIVFGLLAYMQRNGSFDASWDFLKDFALTFSESQILYVMLFSLLIGLLISVGAYFLTRFIIKLNMYALREIGGLDI
jgi:hypothetical protein